MLKRIFTLFVVLFIIISCLSISVSAADSSNPTYDYWTTVFENIKICTYYTYLGEAPPDEASGNVNLGSARKPLTMASQYDDSGYEAYLVPFNVTDLDFYRSNYDEGSFNCAYYIDIPLNLTGGNLSFALEYRGDDSTYFYQTVDGEYYYFTSFRDMITSADTVIEVYQYNSLGEYSLLTEQECFYYYSTSDDDSNLFFSFNFEEIIDLSYIKIVIKTITENIIQTGSGAQSILGRIPFYHYLTLDKDFIYVPPTYEDMVLGGITEVSNKLDQMLFPDLKVQVEVDDLNNKLENTQQNVNDLNAGLEIDEPEPFEQVENTIRPYFNNMNFDYSNRSIGRFWKASVVMRMIMVVGFFSYISFILFGKKA